MLVKKLFKFLITLFAGVFAGVLFHNSANAQMILNRGTASEPTTLDPNKAMAQAANPIVDDMYLTLLERGPDLTLVPGAAETWTVSDDGLTYTFQLRDGVLWSDGVPVTAHDYVYSAQRFVDPETGAIFASYMYIVKNGRVINRGLLPVEELGVSAPDERTVQFVLERPAPFFPDFISKPTIAPVPRHAIEAFGVDWTKPGKMVSNGAFVLAERVPQSYIKLVKNPLFIEADQVQIDEIYYYPTQDLNSSLRQFRSGELDIILNFPPNQIDWIKENFKEELYITPALGTYHLLVNTRRAPFNDLRVRKALSLAIDRNLIANDLLKTGILPSTALVTAEFSNYDGVVLPEEKMSFEDRQQRARDLLSEAGYSPINPLTIEYKYDTLEENQKIAVALEGMWRAIGVQTNLVNTEFRVIIRDRATGDYEVMRSAFFSAYDDAYTFLQRLETGNPSNWSGYSNSEYDDLLMRANSLRDVSKRRALMEQAELMAMADQPLIPIYFYVWRRLVQSQVKGWVMAPFDSVSNRYLRVEPN